MSIKYCYICDNCEKEIYHPKSMLHIKEDDGFCWDAHFCSEDCESEWMNLNKKFRKKKGVSGNSSHKEKTTK